VGLLLVPTTDGKMGNCSGTLVGRRTVLTAAHCLLPGEGEHRFVLDGAEYPVQQMWPHPAFDGTLPKIPPDHDIGVAILADAPPVQPSVLSPRPPVSGIGLVLVGFGVTAEGAQDGYVKRIATNRVQDVEPTRFSILGTGNGVGNLCKGDSGGPAFTVVDGHEIQLGVTSAMERACGVISWDTRVDAYLDWVDQVCGGDLARPDLDGPRVAFVSPTDGAGVPPDLTATVHASDDVAVTEVELLVDDKTAETLTSPPWTFKLSLAAGDHTLTAVARDAAGNQGLASVGVTVAAGTFGDDCTEDSDCQSDLCFADTASSTRYCSQTCVPDGDDCPADAFCVDDQGRSVCSTSPPDTPLTGGCALPSRPAGPAGPVLLLLGLALLALRRR